MKKALITTTVISAIVFSLIAGMQVVQVAKGNPYSYDYVGTEIPPPKGTIPPIISIFSPINKTSYSSNNVTLNLKVDIVKSGNLTFHFGTVYYKTSWQSSNITLNITSLINYESRSVQIPINLTNVPEGQHWIEVYSTVHGDYPTYNEHAPYSPQTIIIHSDFSLITGSSTVNFTIDTTPPSISIENSTYHEGSIFLLSFKVDEPTPWMGYSLDNEANITITGNSTLTGLTDGYHNLIIYANDTAGNMGKSDTAYFTIDTQPSPSPSPLPTPSLSPSPITTPSPSASPTQQPTQLPEHQQVAFQIEAFYAAAGALAIATVAVIAVVFRRRKQQANPDSTPVTS